MISLGWMSMKNLVKVVNPFGVFLWLKPQYATVPPAFPCSVHLHNVKKWTGKRVFLTILRWILRSVLGSLFLTWKKLVVYIENQVSIGIFGKVINVLIIWTNALKRIPFSRNRKWLDRREKGIIIYY